MESANTVSAALPDLAPFIRPGDMLMWGQSHAEPVTLIRALVAQRERLRRIRIFLGIGLDTALSPEHADAFDLLAYCGTGNNRRLAEAGVLDILPAHYSQLPRLIQRGPLKADVVMLQVSMPDPMGRYSLGMAREYLVDALHTARAILAEVHPDVPWTHGGPYLHREDIDLLLDSRYPLPDTEPMTPGPVEQAIGQHVAAFVEDGCTLQAGIGSLPDAVLAHLRDRRDLGVHSGSFGNGFADLHKVGAVTNARKGIDPGVSVCGVLVGGSTLRRFAHRNLSLELRGTDYTHNPRILSSIDRFVAINSAIEVDLTGQVNTEMAGGRYVGGVGGILDFLRAAQSSRGGVPIIALPSTAGPRSRIVPTLSGPVSVPRSDSCVVVTEHGIADMRGLTLAQRIQRMIAIADPAHREQLERAARAQTRAQ